MCFSQHCVHCTGVCFSQHCVYTVQECALVSTVCTLYRSVYGIGGEVQGWGN